MNRDLLTILYEESKSYGSLSDLESLVNGAPTLQNVPLQPLFFALKELAPTQLAEVLPKLSREQRALIVDLDVWERDEISMKKFEFWHTLYGGHNDLELKADFAQSDPFLLYLKGQFNIWEFDVENPEYPEHDHFFLTEDQSFLFEYHKDFEGADTCQELVKGLYARYGVDRAIGIIKTVIAESFSVLQEDCYREKVDRLRDYGFVDYHSALILRSTFKNRALLNKFVSQKTGLTPRVEDRSVAQSLFSKVMGPYKEILPFFSKDLEAVTDVNRVNFLRFNFLRVVNASLALNQVFSQDTKALHQEGRFVRKYLLLGYEFVSRNSGDSGNLFEKLDFFDLYRIGFSLIEMAIAKMTKALEKSSLPAETALAFLGDYWSELITDVSQKGADLFDENKGGLLDQLSEFEKQAELFSNLLPFIFQFKVNLDKILESGEVDNSFYINYKVEEIDFESILISSLINFENGHFESDQVAPKLGVTCAELVSFVDKSFDLEKGKTVLTQEAVDRLSPSLDRFLESFQFPKEGMKEYLLKLLDSNLSGYDFSEISEEDFKYIGGPIILYSNNAETK